MKKYQKLIVHFVNKQDYKKAIDFLNMIESAETRNYEMINYASIFIKHAPLETFDMLQSENFRHISIPKLMPALMGCPAYALVRARNFVQDHCIRLRHNKDSSVHNMSFYLHCKIDSSDELLKFLRKEECAKQEGQAIFFDVTYALNVCK